MFGWRRVGELGTESLAAVASIFVRAAVRRAVMTAVLSCNSDVCVQKGLCQYYKEYALSPSIDTVRAAGALWAPGLRDLSHRCPRLVYALHHTGYRFPVMG